MACCKDNYLKVFLQSSKSFKSVRPDIKTCSHNFTIWKVDSYDMVYVHWIVVFLAMNKCFIKIENNNFLFSRMSGFWKFYHSFFKIVTRNIRKFLTKKECLKGLYHVDFVKIGINSWCLFYLCDVLIKNLSFFFLSCRLLYRFFINNRQRFNLKKFFFNFIYFLTRHYHWELVLIINDWL